MKQILWVDKYKPKQFEDMLLPPLIQEMFQHYIKNIDKKRYHFILSGKAGIGKTSLAKVFCIQSDIAYKEFNASDNRGIEIIQNIVKFYDKNGKRDILILLDESDNITIKAQNLILNLMEYYKKIKIIFTVNNKDHLIDDIHKNCIHIDLEKNIHLEEYVTYFHKICKKENFEIEKDCLAKIITFYQYDIRKIIHTLEMMSINKTKIILPTSIKDMVKKFYTKIHALTLVQTIEEAEKILYYEDMIDLLDFLNESILYFLNCEMEKEDQKNDILKILHDYILLLDGNNIKEKNCLQIYIIIDKLYKIFHE